MTDRPANFDHERAVRRLRRILDTVPFDNVIDWVLNAPEPLRRPWWKRLFH